MIPFKRKRPRVIIHRDTIDQVNLPYTTGNIPMQSILPKTHEMLRGPTASLFLGSIYFTFTTGSGTVRQLLRMGRTDILISANISFYRDDSGALIAYPLQSITNDGLSFSAIYTEDIQSLSPRSSTMMFFDSLTIGNLLQNNSLLNGLFTILGPRPP